MRHKLYPRKIITTLTLVVDELARCYGSQQLSVKTEGNYVMSSRDRQQDDVYASAHGRVVFVVMFSL